MEQAFFSVWKRDKSSEIYDAIKKYDELLEKYRKTLQSELYEKMITDSLSDATEISISFILIKRLFAMYRRKSPFWFVYSESDRMKRENLKYTFKENCGFKGVDIPDMEEKRRMPKFRGKDNRLFRYDSNFVRN